MKWLEEDFLQCLKDWRTRSKGKQFVTKETYQAVVLTTKCTVSIVKYLLKVKKFFFVLTRPFQSDPVESFYSNLRQLNGCLYYVEARGALLAFEKDAENRPGSCFQQWEFAYGPDLLTSLVGVLLRFRKLQ